MPCPEVAICGFSQICRERAEPWGSPGLSRTGTMMSQKPAGHPDATAHGLDMLGNALI
jgi:hypothetical protein